MSESPVEREFAPSRCRCTATAVRVACAPAFRTPPRPAHHFHFSTECRLHTHLEFNTRHLCIGEVVWLHARDGVLDPRTLRRLPEAFHPVGRLYATRYCRTRDEFELDNSDYAAKANARSAIRKF